MKTKERLWTKNFVNASAANFLLACSFNLLMPTIPLYLTEQLNIPHSQIGIVLSSYALALLFIRPFSGYLVDVFPRKTIYIVGLSLFVSMFVGYYFAVTVMFFVIIRFIHGLFWGITTVSANTIAIDIIPSSRRAEGIGYFGVTMNLAMAIAPYIAVNIYENYGFDLLITAALIFGGIAVLTASFIRVEPRPKITQKPPLSFDRFILVKAIPIMLNQILLAFGWGTLVAFAVLFGKEIGIKNSGVFFLFLSAGLVLSRIASGRLVDKGYLHQMMVVAILGIAMGFIGFALVHSPLIYMLSAFVLGIGYGSLFPALQTLYNNMAPRSRRGTANSTYLTGFDLGIGGGMLLGAVIEEHFGFSNMYLLTGILCLIALLIYWFHSRKVYEKGKLDLNCSVEG